MKTTICCKLGRTLGVTALLVLFLVEVTLAQSTSAAGVQSSQPKTVATSAPLCRFGVNLAGALINEFDSPALRIGWYIDYAAQIAPARPQGIQYTPTIRISETGILSYTTTPSMAELATIISANPGSEWLIGNEPDRRLYQDDLKPEVYALAYHDLYHLIKGKDATARIIAGSIVQPTPIRLQYLDKVLQSYQAQFGTVMPVDIWAIHNFILNEASCDHYKDIQICWGADIPPGITATDGLRIGVNDNDRFDLFVEQIVRFRHWMAARGYRHTPLYLSEYGVLMPAAYGFPATRVNQFMTATFDYLLNTTSTETGYPADKNRLVQRLSWYSTNDKKDFNGYLFEKPEGSNSYQLTSMGRNYVTYTNKISETVDLYPVNFTVTPVAPISGSVPVTYVLSAQIANSGNSLAAQSAVVRFTLVNGNGQTEQIGADQTVTLAGCGQHSTRQVMWVPANTRANPFEDVSITFTIDPANTVTEADENNNRMLLLTKQFYLPILAK